MNNPHFDSPGASITPPGISSDYLIEPSYVRARDWGFYCIRDRLTLRQLAVLSGADSGLSGSVYGSFVSNGSPKVVLLDRNPKAISAYFTEMVGGDVCVFDLPNSFLICVLEGDISIFAGTKEKISRCVGSSEMDQKQWNDVISGLRDDIIARLRAKYAAS
jgi:hypothetical protein